MRGTSRTSWGRRVVGRVILFGLAASSALGVEPAYRRLDPILGPVLAVHLDNENVLVASKADEEAWLDRLAREKGDDRAAWRARAEKALAGAGLDFREEAFVSIQRVFGTGMAKATLDLALEGRVVRARITVHWPKGPATPDIGSSAFAFAVRKSAVDSVEILQAGQAPVVLAIAGKLAPTSSPPR